jgi:hypothetical protein
MCVPFALLCTPPREHVQSQRNCGDSDHPLTDLEHAGLHLCACFQEPCRHARSTTSPGLEGPTRYVRRRSSCRSCSSSRRRVKALQRMPAAARTACVTFLRVRPLLLNARSWSPFLKSCGLWCCSDRPDGRKARRFSSTRRTCHRRQRRPSPRRSRCTPVVSLQLLQCGTIAA